MLSADARQCGDENLRIRRSFEDAQQRCTDCWLLAPGDGLNEPIRADLIARLTLREAIPAGVGADIETAEPGRDHGSTLAGKVVQQPHRRVNLEGACQAQVVQRFSVEGPPRRIIQQQRVEQMLSWVFARPDRPYLIGERRDMRWAVDGDSGC